MPEQTTPHTEFQQNRSPAQSDAIEATGEGQTQTALGANVGKDDIPSATAGAQTGTNRGPQFIPATSGRHGAEPPNAAYEGTVSTRTQDGTQGITAHSTAEENSRQQKVVQYRADAQAGVNHELDRAS